MGGNNCKSFSPKHNLDGPKRRVKRGDSDSQEKEDYVEGVVCKENEIKENEMKLLPLGDDGKKILLIKQKGELHAIGTKCTHYGAVLNTGALGEGRVRCPWHGACFNIKTGDIEDYPGLDSLPCYKVSVNNQGLVTVRARRKDLELNRRTKELCPFDSKNGKTVVIVGGGPSGATCAETLRQEGFTGRIVLVCRESILPYDRVKVSKDLDFDAQKFCLRPQMFYDEHKIETKLGVEATGLNENLRTVKLSNGEELKYDYLYLATGSKARLPDVPGVALSNIFTLRDYTDTLGLKKQVAPGKHVVVLGMSFIGMEAAACCIGKCESVTVVGRDAVPLRVFGDEIGGRTRQEFESKGVKFIFNNNIAKFLPRDDDSNVLGKVELLDGTILPADVAIAGIGTTFYTEWLKGTSLEMTSQGAIVVDKFLKTNVENIYAGGDIAYAPVFASGDEPAAIGHYPLAHYHGKIAASNIAGKETPLKSVPFFWTMLFGKGYRYAGHGRASEIKVYGSLENFKFFAYHFKDGKVVAMTSVGADPLVSDFANLLSEGKSLTEEEVKKDPTGWVRAQNKDVFKGFVEQTPTNVESRFSSTWNFQHKGYHTLSFKCNNATRLTLLQPKNTEAIFKHGKYLSKFRRILYKLR